MKVAVTTASGQLGSSVIKELLAISPAVNIIGLARTPQKATGLGVEIRPGNYDDINQLESSLQGVESLLMVTSMSTPDERMVQHTNIVTAAKRAGVRKIVCTSIQGRKRYSFLPVVLSSRKMYSGIRP